MSEILYWTRVWTESTMPFVLDMSLIAGILAMTLLVAVVWLFMDLPKDDGLHSVPSARGRAVGEKLLVNVGSKEELRAFIHEDQVTADQLAAGVVTKEDLRGFIQARSYYYLPKWETLEYGNGLTNTGSSCGNVENSQARTPHIVRGPFNWAACFLTVFWMAYRKMYLYVVV